jgi:hypothetical protein
MSTKNLCIIILCRDFWSTAMSSSGKRPFPCFSLRGRSRLPRALRHLSHLHLIKIGACQYHPAPCSLQTTTSIMPLGRPSICPSASQDSTCGNINQPHILESQHQLTDTHRTQDHHIIASSSNSATKSFSSRASSSKYRLAKQPIWILDFGLEPTKNPPISLVLRHSLDTSSGVW